MPCVKKSFGRVSRNVSSVIVVSAMLSAAAQAQTAAEQTGGLEEIVVTANKRSENLQDVPINISAVTASSLAAAGSYNVTDLEKIAPGLQIYQTATAVLPFIRGVGSNLATSGFENSVVIYLDGIYQGNKLGNAFDLANIERIEVLKGPQGTLFGRNATGGAISIITRDPGNEVEVSAEGGYGRFKEKRAKAYAAGPITDTLSASLAFTGRWDEGYIYNPDLARNANPARNMMGMAKLVWKPSDNFTARLSGSYFKHSDPTFLSPHVVPGTLPTIAGAPYNLTPNYDKDIARSAHLGVLKTSGYRVTLNLDYDLGAVKIVSLTGYLSGQSTSLSNSDLSQATVAYSGSGQPSHEFSHELQIQSNNDGPLKWIGGLYYLHLFESYGKNGKNFVGPSNLPSPIRPADLLVPGASANAISSDLWVNAYAAFGEMNLSVTDKLRITAGVRYNDEKRHINGTLFRYTAVPAAGNINVPLYNTVLGSEPLVFGTTQLNAIDKSKSFSKVTFRVSADYKFTDDIMAYASFNRGFKSGGFNGTSITPTQVPVKPEVLDAYEIGLKTELFDRRVRFNTSAFYYDYSNLQVSLISAIGVTSVQNAASARTYGLDIDITAAATDNLTIRTALNLLDTKYKNFQAAQIFMPRTATPCSPAVSLTPAQAAAQAAAPKVAGSMSCALNASGLNLVFAPKLTANFAADYNIPLGESRLLLTGSLYYNDGYDIVPGGFFAHINSYEAVSLSATFYAPEDRYFIRGWVDNLTNDRHPVYISPQALGFQEVSARPVSYGVTVGFKFGG